MRALLLGAVAAAALFGPAQAQRFTNLNGAKLAQMCTNRDPKWIEACEAYIDGIADTVAFYQRLRPSDASKGAALPAYVCVPGNITGPQLRQTVVSYAEQHRDKLNDQASGLVLHALDAAYRCPGETPRVRE